MKSTDRFSVDAEAGLLIGARCIPSPNHDDRPDPRDISLLVIHNISLPPGEFGGDYVSSFFTNRLNPGDHPYFEQICQMQVSSHLYIRRDGEVIQYVPFHKRAWHAGQSEYLGRSRCNDFSIGIELEGTDSLAYEKIQYERLAGVTALLLRAYDGLSSRHITGHSDIAPGRKTDPGPAFDWDRYRALLD